MFSDARIELTAYYLSIIMAICLVFSVVIYNGATADLDRIQRSQRYTSPIIQEIRERIIFRLLYFNLFILGLTGAAGYYLAGRTLAPIQKNMEEQKNFVMNASHSLRTPLTALKTELEIALRDVRIGNRDLLESNLEEVNKMKRLTDYLLKQSKLDEPIIEKEVLNLRDIAVAATGKKSGVDIELIDSYIKGNKSSLIELLNILLDNAKKYGGSKKHPVVIVKNKTLEVRDFGRGIDKEEIPHIFEKFYRGQGALGLEGYGLGLSIAKQIADAHGAKIKVKSNPGSGTTFKVVFS